MIPSFTHSARYLLRSIPKSPFAYRCARAYVNWYRGENNHLEDSNGEAWARELLLPHCRVAFDVGANVGDWSERALKTQPGLELHCFEPSSVTFASLKRRGLRGAQLNNVALSNHDGDAKLHLYGDNAATNSIVCGETNSYAELQGAEQVRTLTFDTYVRERGPSHVDYVKVDVEGAEMLVLGGMEESFRARAVDVVQFEYGRFSIFGHVFLLDLFRLFERHDFMLYKLVQNTAERFDAYSDDLESFQYQNWLAVRKESRLAAVVQSVAKP
jgi:FkbM family methyltransferase